MPTATEIARWIIWFRKKAGVPVDPMSLQKLVFYAQAFRLARHGELLFAEPIQAWEQGPVVSDVWREFRARDGVIDLSQDLKPLQFDDELDSYLRGVVEFFSRLHAFELSDATHKEEPWVAARAAGISAGYRDEVIEVEKIRTYYADLLWEGEEALSRQQLLDRIPEPALGFFYRAGVCKRRMTAHPLYDVGLAELLARPVRHGPKLPKHFYAPIKKRDLVSLDEP